MEKSRGQWLCRPELSDAQKLCLRDLLTRRGLEQKYDIIEDTLLEAGQHYQGAAACADPSPSAQQKLLQRIRKGLAQAMKGLDEIPPPSHRIVDQHFFLANDNDATLLRAPLQGYTSATAGMLSRIDAACDHLITTLQREKVVRRRDNARLFAVDFICQQLHRITAGRYKPSTGEHSFCYELVLFFCQEVLGQEINFVDRILQAVLGRK